MRSDSRYPEIDGLRGFACLSVVAHHCYFYGGRYQWPFDLLATALIAAGLFYPKLRKLFSSRVIVSVGLISYSLYLIHLPVIDFIHRWTAAFSWPEWQQLLFYQGLVLPVCALVAYPFYVAFERPFLRVAASDRTAVLIDAHPQSASISRD